MSLSYPKTRTVEAVEELAGVRFADPYRWLEDDTEEVTGWQHEQGELAAGYVRDWPHFGLLRESVARFSGPRFGSVPRYAGGRWFRTHIPDGMSQAQVLVADQPLGAGRVLFDPVGENPALPPFVSWISPSPDGVVLAVGVCADGSEQNTIRLIDVETGGLLPGVPGQVLMDNWCGGVQWLADSTGFFFSAIEGKAVDFTQQVYLHRRAGEPSTVLVDVPWLEPADYRMVLVSGDGRHAVAVQRMMDPVPVAIASLGTVEELTWRPFVTDVAGTVAGHLVGETFIAVTDVDAPRGRVVSIALDNPVPNDASTWTEVVPASDAVIRTVTPVGDRLFLGEFVDTYARVRIVSMQGDPAGEVPMPGRGAIAEWPFAFMTLVPRGHPDQYLFGFSTLTSGWGTYRYRPETGDVETLQEPAAILEDTVVVDRRATSPDGTAVPFHLVHRRGLDISRPRPALIYAYGGFNTPFVPQFPGPMAAFVAAGGVFVHAHLRGGAELGSDWWHGGRLKNKQNCYADLYAIAGDLIGSGMSSPGRLAVTGGSNGGLMAGVALTQRPDLWAVAVPRVPLLDLIGACRHGYGRMAISNEYGDPDDPLEVRRLAGFSPYQLIQAGVRYPAVFLDAGSTDPRCPPWHARKFGARLQAATRGDAPVLIRIWGNVGHGWATDKDIAITENTEWLAFVMRQLDLTPGPAAAPSGG